MKTTKDIAELFSAEIDRIGKGEVRTTVIAGLEKCSNAMIKLARLEMEYAWKDWGARPPNVPWIASSAGPTAVESPHRSEPLKVSAESPAPRVKASKDGVSERVNELEAEIEKAKAALELKDCTSTLRAILQDKIQKWQDKIDFLVATKSKVSEP